MDKNFIGERISELRLKKNVSEISDESGSWQK